MDKTLQTWKNWFFADPQTRLKFVSWRKNLKSFSDFQETVKQYEAISAADLLETIRMEFSELKAEAFCSLSMT